MSMVGGWRFLRTGKRMALTQAGTTLLGSERLESKGLTRRGRY